MWWNLIGMCLCVGLGYLDYFIISSYPNECAGIRLANYAMLSLYGAQFILQAMCLCGLEMRYCNALGLVGVVIYNLIILTWA